MITGVLLRRRSHLPCIVSQSPDAVALVCHRGGILSGKPRMSPQYDLRNLLHRPGHRIEVEIYPPYSFSRCRIQCLLSVGTSQSAAVLKDIISVKIVLYSEFSGRESCKALHSALFPVSYMSALFRCNRKRGSHLHGRLVFRSIS